MRRARVRVFVFLAIDPSVLSVLVLLVRAGGSDSGTNYRFSIIEKSDVWHRAFSARLIARFLTVCLCGGGTGTQM